MTIINVDNAGKQINDIVFNSLNDVFNYCMNELDKNYVRPKDDLIFNFKIIDSGEEFCLYARANFYDYGLEKVIYF